VFAARTMAVFTAIPCQVRTRLQRQIARVIGIIVLWVPAGHMATEALGIEVPGDIAALTWMDNALGRHRMRGVLPNLIGRCMALAAGFAADKTVAAGMLDRPKPQLLE